MKCTMEDKITFLLISYSCDAQHNKYRLIDQIISENL
jgi:hypothetical protein